MLGNIIKKVFGDKSTRDLKEAMPLVEKTKEAYDKLQGLELLPGMPVEAYIRTDDRTPMNYLIKPIADYFNKAFRES